MTDPKELDDEKPEAKGAFLREAKREIGKAHDAFDAFSAVRPGLTGWLPEERNPHVGPTAAQVREAYSKPHSEADIAALTAALPANIAARKRNIAALAQELRKPFAPRYPHTGRDDRVTGYHRWSDKS